MKPHRPTPLSSGHPNPESPRLIQRRRHWSCGALLALASATTATGAQAGAAEWSSTNIQYLYGDNYQSIEFDPVAGKLVGTDDSRSVITLEHVNGWKYGDNFFFLDITNGDNTDTASPTSLYAEISPRLSLSKISGKNLSAGLLKDVLITTTLETGNGFHNYLYGLAVDLDLPNVPVFQINYYLRHEVEAQTDVGHQITLVWLYPFAVGEAALSFEGFLDYAFGLDNELAATEDNIVAGPRLLLDVGKFAGAPGQVQVGVEHQIWRNKFGIDGIDEDVTQAMVKWIW